MRDGGAHKGNDEAPTEQRAGVGELKEPREDGDRGQGLFAGHRSRG